MLLWVEREGVILAILELLEQKNGCGEMVGWDLCWQRCFYGKFGAVCCFVILTRYAELEPGYVCLYYVLHEPVRF